MSVHVGVAGGIVERGNDDGIATRLVTHEPDARDVRDLGHLLGRGREDLVESRARGGQGGDPSQRGLLVRQATSTIARLGVGHRDRDEFGKVPQAVFEVGWQRLALHRADVDHPPHRAVDDDGNANRRAHRGVADACGDRPLQHGVVVDPRRFARVEDRRRDARTVEWPPSADGELPEVRRVRCRAQQTDHRHGSVRLVAPHQNHRRFEGALDLLHHGRDEVRCRGRCGHERGDPP